ncbi:MAG: class I SAM-dependent methyltransferase [Gammaproteobacteria bacterium]|nr:class I SAM-dependent methyltransferase [Gammaproteobacteria bacterium]
MRTNTSTIQNVSDTAFWVASYRAIESEKKNPLFRDPLAGLLAGEYGKKVSNSMKPFAQYAYWSVTIRTRLIDEYILKYAAQGYKTVVNLGAGLDTRPYRLSLPQEVQWIEVDFPEVIELKNEKLKDQKPKCKLERIGLNLSHQTKRKKLFDELNHRIGPALILTEGVIPYLNEDSVSSLANDMKDQSNFKLWVAEYYSSKVYPRYQSQKFKDLLGDSPFQFFPANWFSFFEDCGWIQKEMHYLYDEAAKHNRKFPLPWWASALKVIIGEKTMMKDIRKSSAYIVFEKK